MEELIKQVEQWAAEKDLLKEENKFAQFAKFIEESGELARGILKKNTSLTADSFGDVLVTLIILAAQTGYDLKECLKVAYEEIKNRKGKTVGGTFIKEEA